MSNPRVFTEDMIDDIIVNIHLVKGEYSEMANAIIDGLESHGLVLESGVDSWLRFIERKKI